MNFIIVGVGRSGTSLLQSILSSHSKISIPPETGFLRKNVLNKDELKNFTHTQALESNEKLERLMDVIDELRTKETWGNEIEYYNDLTNTYRIIQEKEMLGDKDPRLIEYIAGINKIFPVVKFIHLIRDPRDVLLSKKKASWSKDKPSWYHIFANYIQLKLGHKIGLRITDNYLLVSYEELLSNAEDVLTRICDFLQVDFESEMLSFQETAAKLVAEEEKQWKMETLGPLLTNNSGKWKGKLLDSEVALTELLCTEAFHLGGYKKSKAYDNLSFTSKLKVKSQFIILKLLGLIYIPFRLYSQLMLIKWKY